VTPPLVDLRGVSHVFAGHGAALEPVDLTVRSGDYVTMVGPSGSGKSTLLNIMGLLEHPSTGSYRFDGDDMTATSERERAKCRAGRIGFVFQAFHLIAHRTVVENVELALTYAGSSRALRRQQALGALERAGLPHKAQALPRTLSGGEAQRAAIARAIVKQPRLLLCDEPTGNLDSKNTEAVLRVFDELSDDGLTMIVVTHDDAVSDRGRTLVRLLDGRISDVTIR
jgi:putative ABC transport system ATP-binding protein